MITKVNSNIDIIDNNDNCHWKYNIDHQYDKNNIYYNSNNNNKNNKYNGNDNNN